MLTSGEQGKSSLLWAKFKPKIRPLQREVDWLLDDAVAAMKTKDGPETPTTWKTLSRGMKDGSAEVRICCTP